MKFKPIKPTPFEPFFQAALCVGVLYFMHGFLENRGIATNPEWVNVGVAAFLMACQWSWREFRWSLECPR